MAEDSNSNLVILTYTIKTGLKILFSYYNFTCILEEEDVRHVKFQIDTDPDNLIPTLEAIDKNMIEREEQNQFQIIKLEAQSPNCTFSTN